MKAIRFLSLLGILIFIAGISLYPKIIYSTEEGGNWNEPATWRGGIIPADSDDVVICSEVTVTEEHTSGSIIVKEIGLLNFNLPKDCIFTVIGDFIIDGRVKIGEDAEVYAQCIYNHNIIDNFGIIVSDCPK